MKKIRIGLISHLVRDYNLGCSALAISNIRLMDEVFEKKGVDVEYIVILAEPKEKIDLEEYTSLKGITSNRYSYRTYPRLKPVLKNPTLLWKTDAFENLDFVIDLCGGDGYTDNYGLIRLLAESMPVFGCRIKNVPCIFGPQTIGPFNTIIGKSIAKLTLGKLKETFVRDISSYKCCSELKIKSETYQVIDVAFALPFEKKSYNDGYIHIGINVSGLLYNGGYNHDNYFNLGFSYKEFIDQLIPTLLSDEKIKVHLVPHVIEDSEGVDDDYSVCRLIHENYPQCELPNKFKTASEAKSYISAMDLFSGARMHSTIGAISSGVPVIPVAYSRKFNGLYDTLKYAYLIDAKEKISVNDAVKKFMQYYSEINAMRQNVWVSKTIYSERLKKYKEKLCSTLELD